MLARRNTVVPFFAEPVLRDVDRLFGAVACAPRAASADRLSFPVNVWQDDGAIVFEAELPGFGADEIEIDADRQSVTIRASRSTEVAEQTPGDSEAPEAADESSGVDQTRTVLRSERTQGTFERRFKLPVPVNSDAVTAQLKDGILTVTLPRVDGTERRRVRVEAN
ncbi:MAG: Hsp20/alpha crystallin family protein [Planctomycetota bacterium]